MWNIIPYERMNVLIAFDVTQFIPIEILWDKGSWTRNWPPHSRGKERMRDEVVLILFFQRFYRLGIIESFSDGA